MKTQDHPILSALILSLLAFHPMSVHISMVYIPTQSTSSLPNKDNKKNFSKMKLLKSILIASTTTAMSDPNEHKYATIEHIAEEVYEIEDLDSLRLIHTVSTTATAPSLTTTPQVDVSLDKIKR